MATENDSYIRIRISKELKKELINHCNDNDKNMSAIVRRMIENYLKEENK